MPHKESKPGWLSVTEVLNLSIPKPFLIAWYGKNGTAKCEQIKRDSQQLGLNVHALIENRFNGVEMTGELRHLKMVDNFWNKFVEPHGVKPLSLEQTVKDDELKVQGTFDAQIECDGKTMIADWKTSNQLDVISGPLQLSAYDHLLNGNGQGVLVRIDKEKDKVEARFYTDLKKYWPVFEACIKVAKYVKFGLEDAA